jgi:hypothetical protein
MIKILTKRRIKFIVFITIAVMPFIFSIQTIGLDSFLDSFENPEYYVLLKQNDKNTIIQKSNHPDFSVKSGDVLLYYKDTGELASKKVYMINSIGPIKRYSGLSDEEHPLFEPQVVGKIIKQTDNNLINSISINLWDISIHSLNIRALISN